jgi:cystathionine beta-lyase/cystathionine gamma-synthase
LNSAKPFLNSVKDLLKNLPKSWVELTTHRLDVYNESEAKSEFLTELKKLLLSGDYSSKNLELLPTAYDYIRLGHQLSSLLEWVLAEINNVSDDQVITFASNTMPILAILRKNALSGQSSYIYYDCDTSPLLDESRLEQIYGYNFRLKKVNDVSEVQKHTDGTVVFVTQQSFKSELETNLNIDISVNSHHSFGSAMVIHNTNILNIVSDVQHVRRRETIAMTPVNCLNVLNEIIDNETDLSVDNETEYKDDLTSESYKENKQIVIDCIKENTGSHLAPLIASSGLSIQYAMMMGLVENAIIKYPNKQIKILLPPNCYGGTNDQSRRIADLIPNVDIVDLHVDGGQDLVNSLEFALNKVAEDDAIALILAEIPTNPRVEVPDMKKLGEVLTIDRFTSNNEIAIKPYFMVDQTFCPNVKLLHHTSELRDVKTISFASGSKFPSGGRCIAGYCAANNVAKDLMDLISSHLVLSDNLANYHQIQTLAETMPSMPERIVSAYNKTREFVNLIQDLIPKSKIYYVTDEIAEYGFMPSVFSLDLPVAGETLIEHHDLQKQLNKKLIEFMIQAHPNDCKNCVSYGQLKGSYWTIPATSTQGTTKEDDKDYVARVALSSNVDVQSLFQTFTRFCSEQGLI